MRNNLLVTAGFTLLLGLCTNLHAQEVKKSAKVLAFEDYDMCYGGDFHAISPNKKYAVGYSPEWSGQKAYMWNFETKELTVLNEGAAKDRAQANSVSNDGVVAGNFLDADSPDGNNIPTLVPGEYKDGKWTRLPRVPSMPNVGSDMNGSAERISADGRIICGSILRSTGVSVQVIWKDGELQPVSEETLLGQGNYGYCFAQEGKIIGGWAGHDDGCRSPAIWVDGKMTRLEGLKSSTEIYEETGEDLGFFDGILQDLNEDGSVGVGYFDWSGEGFECKPFVWSQKDGLRYFAESGLASCISEDGTVYGTSAYMGSAFIYKDGIMTDLEDYLKDEYNFVPEDGYIPMSCPRAVSKDGKIIAGYALTVNGGVPVMLPRIIMLEEETIIDAIDSTTGDNFTIASNVITDALEINGKYTSAQVYNTLGATVLKDNQQNGTISFEGLNNGIYYVKVSDGLQSQTFRVIKK